MGSNHPSPTPTQEEASKELIESLHTLTREVQTLKSPTILGRTRRNFLRIGLGFVLGTGTVMLWPDKQPERFPLADHGNPADEKPDEDSRYIAALRRHLDACAKRWDNVFSVEHIAPDGTVTVSLQHGVYVRGNYAVSLTLQCDENRNIVYLHESQYGSTIDIHPRHYDIQQETISTDLGGGTIAHAIWTTKDDTMEAIRTSDGKRQELTINGQRVDPQGDPEKLARLLSSPHRIALFQQIFCDDEGPGKLLELLLSSEFTSDYRIPFEEFQRRNFRGNCNDFTEMSCELLARHGFDPHVLSIWPAQRYDRLTKPWHQAAALELPDGTLLIIDNGKLIYRDSKEAYAEMCPSSEQMAVIPGGAGYFRWERADNAIARWLQHLGVR